MPVPKGKAPLIAAADLKKYRKNELTLQALADQYRVSVSTVWRDLMRRGVSRGSRRGRPRNRQKHPTVIALARQGCSRSQIAERVGISPEWVRCILSEHGLAASLRILKCQSCGSPVATGHKTFQSTARIRVICISCLELRTNARVADRLRAFRLAMNMSIAQLSAKSRLSQAAIGNYERGLARPTWSSVQKLATGLGVPPTRLVGTPRRHRKQNGHITSAG